MAFKLQISKGDVELAPLQREALEELIRNVTQVVGYYLVKRKLRKLGAPEWAAFLGASALSSLANINQELVRRRVSRQKDRHEVERVMTMAAYGGERPPQS